MTGIMGGTFDPIHYGHLRLAEHIREEFGLERVLFIPAGAPPHKVGNKILPAEHRLEMTRIAISDNPVFELVDHEIRAEGYSYTVETLEWLLKRGYGPLALILGADSVVQMEKWYQPDGILGRACILAAPRPETDETELHDAILALYRKYGGDIRVSKATAMPHASTDIRDSVAKGRTIRYLVPEGVRQYIERNGFYREDII